MSRLSCISTSNTAASVCLISYRHQVFTVFWELILILICVWHHLVISNLLLFFVCVLNAAILKHLHMYLFRQAFVPVFNCLFWNRAWWSWPGWSWTRCAVKMTFSFRFSCFIFGAQGLQVYTHTGFQRYLRWKLRHHVWEANAPSVPPHLWLLLAVFNYAFSFLDAELFLQVLSGMC